MLPGYYFARDFPSMMFDTVIFTEKIKKKIKQQIFNGFFYMMKVGKLKLDLMCLCKQIVSLSGPFS